MYVIISFIFTNQNNILHESNLIFQYYKIIIGGMLLFLLLSQIKITFCMNQIIYFQYYKIIIVCMLLFLFYFK